MRKCHRIRAFGEFCNFIWHWWFRMPGVVTRFIIRSVSAIWGMYVLVNPLFFNCLNRAKWWAFAKFQFKRPTKRFLITFEPFLPSIFYWTDFTAPTQDAISNFAQHFNYSERSFIIVVARNVGKKNDGPRPTSGSLLFRGAEIQKKISIVSTSLAWLT